MNCEKCGFRKSEAVADDTCDCELSAPVITLGAIKHTAWASEETHCYQATLYVDGEKWGVVSNDGHGGCDSFHGTGPRNYGDIQALDKRIAATMPGTDFGAIHLEESLESICCGIVNEWLTNRDFKRKMKSHVLFNDPARPGLWQVKVRKGITHAAEIAELKARHPDYKFLSDMPEAEAKAAFTASE